MLRTSNPVLGDNTFSSRYSSTSEVMTISGTVNKTFILVGLLMMTALISWYGVMGGSTVTYGLIIVGAIGALIIGIVLAFKKEWAPVLAPVYALLEGLLMGAISAMAEMQYAGIVLQALLLTAGVLFSLLMAYKTGIIKATENFKLGVFAATGAIGLLYLISFIMSMFGVSMPYIHDNGVIGIGISVVIVVIAALNLVLDFDFIEKGAASRSPKYMEWYAAFGLMVTLIWLYLEILRLLIKLNSRK